MKKILLALSLLITTAFSFAFEVYTPKGTVDTWAEVHPTTGVAALKQDMIYNLNSGQPTRTPVKFFGRNSVVNNVTCSLWEGPTCQYIVPPSPMQMVVSSSSADDTLAGTGLQKVAIEYLDTNYIERQEIVNMNGVTGVNTVATNILRINGVHVAQVGTGFVPAGNISIKNLAGTATYGYLPAGRNLARQGIYTVPAGKYLYLSHWQASSGAASGTRFTIITIGSDAINDTFTLQLFAAVDEIGTLNGGVGVNLPTPLRFPPRTNITMSAVSDAANANVVAIGAIMGWLETQ